MPYRPLSCKSVHLCLRAALIPTVPCVACVCPDLVWSDPEDIDTWSVSPRGAGWLFGGKVTSEVSKGCRLVLWVDVTMCAGRTEIRSFCDSTPLVHRVPICPTVGSRRFPAPKSSQFNHVNSISLIARAHQLVQEGYKYMFQPENSLVTVWSAPNYCYRCGNVASVMEVREGGKVDEDSFKIFDAGGLCRPPPFPYTLQHTFHLLTHSYSRGAPKH